MSNDMTVMTTLTSGSVPAAAKAASGNNSIPFTLLASELRPLAEAVGKRAPGYRQIYAAFLDGKFEAEKIGVSRYVRRADLPLIAEVMGLTASAPAKSPKARGASRSAPVAISA